jgi:hypothetical protein
MQGTLRFDRRSLLSGSAAAALGATLPSACCPCAATGHTWNNALNSAGVDPEHFLTPRSLVELVAIVQKAEREGKRVRMTGSGHSFSDVAFTDDYLLSPKGLTNPLPLDKPELAPIEMRGGWVRVEAGITVKELNLHLERHHLALTNMGGYDAQTIVGAATTGTHGSGLAYGPIASQIRSLELVTTEGEVLKVEPDPGITRNFPGFVRTHQGNVPARLVNDTALFNALTVSLGCMGIVYAVVLEVVPEFWLHEKRTLTTWGALRSPGGFLHRLLNGQRLDPEGDDNPSLREPDHYEIYVSPYPRHRGRSSATHPCLLTRRYRIPPNVARTPGQRRRARNGDHVLVAAARISKQGQALAEFIDANPRLVPWIQRESIKALEDRDDYIDQSFRVFHLGPLNAMRVTGIEMAFALEQTIQATERMFVEAQRLAADGYFHSSPPSLRFVAPAAADLAMMNGRRTTMLEMGMLVCQNGADELLRRYEKIYIDELKARPHWGLDQNVLTSFAEVEALYGAPARHWYEVYKRYNRNGTFNGAFTDRLKISVQPGV